MDFGTSHFEARFNGICHVNERTWHVRTLRCDYSNGTFFSLYNCNVARSLYHIGDSFVLTVGQRTIIYSLNSHNNATAYFLFYYWTSLCALHSPYCVRVRYVVFFLNTLCKDVPVGHYFFLLCRWYCEDNLTIARYCIV